MLGAKAKTQFGGSLNDNSAPPSNTLSDAKALNEFAFDIAVYLYQFLQANGLKPDPTGIYFIVTSEFSPNPFFCGFHNALLSGGNPLFQFAWVPNTTGDFSSCELEGVGHSGDPYLAPNNYSAGTHAIVNATAHEFMETITDPLITAWYADSNGNEIGDACDYVFQNWVQLTNSTRWKIQEEWSNQVNGCLQGGGRPVQLLGAASNSSTVTTFNIPGATYGIFGTGINDAGAIAGVYYDANFYVPSAALVRDSLGNITSFNVPGATWTAAQGITSNGTITGSYSDANGTHGYLRDPLGNFATFDVNASALSTLPRTINAAGAVTGRYIQPPSRASHGFLRDPLGNITTFDGPGMPYTTVPLSINDNGDIAGFYGNLNQPFHGFVRDALGNITTFDVPGVVNGTVALSINLAGAIAGTCTDVSFVKHGFVRSPSGGFVTFDAPGAVYGTVAHSINKDGAVAGFYSDAEGVSHGFVRDPYGNFTTLSDIPWSINDYGMTTGYQTVPLK